MPKEKLTRADRRTLVLRVLGGESVLALSKEYGVARSWIYALADEAQIDQEEKIKEVERELEFRKKVSEFS